MVYEKSFLQHFRDADADGLIGAKGYFGFMTDLASEQLHFEGKGNDTLPEKYGAAWIYTKCRLQDCIPIGFEEEVHAECRISRVDKARLWQDMKVEYKGRPVCRGRLESCIYHLGEKKLKPVKFIELSESLKEEADSEIDRFSRPASSTEGMEKVYEYKAAYSDLDKNGHMTNQRYLPMFLNAAGRDALDGRFLKDLELHFIGQTYYNETLSVYSKAADSALELLALKENGSIAAWCRMDLCII